MPALPRPDLPPGAQRDLVDALHDLHHRAGWPSLRTLAKSAGCSHTTVSGTFSSPRLPSWGVVELLVEAMSGDVADFHHLWLQASARDGERADSAPAMAGRRQELTAVRRHLETGSGLLLVTGEAGIGKTTLVRGATATVDGFVATGACLPLSTEVPLLPIAEALRSIYEYDDGQWLKDALAGCPAYVADTLPRLLPDLPGGHEAEGGGTGSLLHLFSAIAAVLTELSELRPLAVVVEDLHWADSATLDLVEQLANRPRPSRIVGTWRLDDAGTSEEKQDWFSRVRRSRSTRLVELSALTMEETATQLRLVSGIEPDADLVARIHARSAGHPLFTEHLATQAHDTELPRLLVDLLDRRLGALTGAEWVAARTLGLADRDLRDDLLQQSTGLAHEELTTALHELHSRRLIAPEAGGVRLSHPLLAEAVRRRVMPGEAAEGHRQLALALATAPDASAAEIAVHWQAAGDRDHELDWQIRAARAARTRFAAREELAAWLRVLDLWPSGRATAGSESTPLAEAYVRAMRGAEGVPDIEAGTRIARAAAAAELPPEGRAAVLLRTGDWWLAFDEAELGLAHLDEAVSLSSGPAIAEALMVRAQNRFGLGRWDEAAADLDSALDLLPEVSDPDLAGRVLGAAAWQRALEGQYDDARALLDRARSAPGLADDPARTVRMAADETDVMLLAGAPLAQVRAAAEPVLAEADRLGMDYFWTRYVRHNLVEACLQAADVPAAGALLERYTSVTDDPVNQRLRIYLAAVEVRRGDLEGARRLLASSGRPPALVSYVEEAARYADAQLWVGEADQARAHLVEALELMLPTAGARAAAPVLVAAARATADSAGGGRTGIAAADRLREFLAAAADDPFGPRAIGVQVRAYAASWAAELGRASGSATVADWSVAASEWDALGWPHDAAYCRWRAAEVALVDGQGTVAGRLLRRAAADARQHRPLGDAIAQTAAYSAQS
jgi:tetratricopeptide (TPR) repeat protein